MPISKNYLAIERAVHECAIAGCETIWLICSKQMTPLIRHRLGDWIYDPTINLKVLKDLWDAPSRLKQIPIFYVPIHPKDRHRRVGLSWSILYGYNRARKISRMFSRWSTPAKYYVAFPHGVYTPSQLKDIRPEISSKKSMFLTFNGKTAKDGEMLGFTFDSDDYTLLRQAFKEEEQRLFKNVSWNNGVMEKEKIPYEERYTGRFISLPTLLKYLPQTPDRVFPINWYYNISDWDKYCMFLGSKERKYLKRPRSTFKYHEFNPIGQDAEYDEELDKLVEEIDEEK